MRRKGPQNKKKNNLHAFGIERKYRVLNQTPNNFYSIAWQSVDIGKADGVPAFKKYLAVYKT